MKNAVGFAGLALIAAGLAWFHPGLGLCFIGVVCLIVGDIL